MRNLIAIFVLAVVAVHTSTSAKADVANRHTILHIDFQSGFEETHIIFVVDGKVTFDKTISTNPVVGLAGRFDCPVSRESVRVILKNPAVQFIKTLHVADGAYIGVSIEGSKVKLVQSKTIFYYD